MRRDSWNDHEPAWVLALKLLAIVSVIGIIVGAACIEWKKKRACEDRGGRVVYYDCYATVRCHTTAHGNGQSSTVCAPERHCKWRCDAPPERPEP